ncbi:hypothetical protein [Aquitalea sp.]|uniref:hypothetical protein n=1 Tax=Aquitalea sp. TaxID=1872623 RepID=UPI00258640C3|nr:hypothetical protein [Aquitalea sp.]
MRKLVFLFLLLFFRLAMAGATYTIEGRWILFNIAGGTVEFYDKNSISESGGVKTIKILSMQKLYRNTPSPYAPHAYPIPSGVMKTIALDCDNNTIQFGHTSYYSTNYTSHGKDMDLYDIRAFNVREDDSKGKVLTTKGGMFYYLDRTFCDENPPMKEIEVKNPIEVSQRVIYMLNNLDKYIQGVQ